MSVNINFKAASAASQWASVKTGDFVIAEGTPEFPLQNGLYRVFLVPQEGDELVYCMFPLFNGPFPEGVYPVFINSSQGFPKLKHRVSKVNIDVEVVE
jgi:hypothetical protein